VSSISRLQIQVHQAAASKWQHTSWSHAPMAKATKHHHADRHGRLLPPHLDQVMELPRVALCPKWPPSVSQPRSWHSVVQWAYLARLPRR